MVIRPDKGDLSIIAITRLPCLPSILGDEKPFLSAGIKNIRIGRRNCNKRYDQVIQTIGNKFPGLSKIVAPPGANNVRYKVDPSFYIRIEFYIRVATATVPSGKLPVLRAAIGSGGI